MSATERPATAHSFFRGRAGACRRGRRARCRGGWLRKTRTSQARLTLNGLYDLVKLKLSVLIPVYNEARTIDQVLRLVSAVPIEKEIIVVDDASVDGTRAILADWDGRDGVRVIFHEKNGGKGTAVATAIRAAGGEILIIQDADLEYDPSEYPILLKPIEAGRADVVYGSRF